MDNNSPYLWNPPEGADTQSITKVQNDRLSEILNAPLTGEDIAYKVSKAGLEGRNPNLTFDEFELYDEWHKKQEINWWEVVSGGFGMFFKDIGSGVASLQPFGEGHSMKSAAMNWIPTNLAATGVEAFGRGTRDMVGLYKMASENQNSPFYRLFNPNGDKYQRFIDFNHLADWNATSQRILEGKENVVLPDTQTMLNKDISGFSASDLFKVNNALAHAGSYFLDPVALMTMGGSSVAKTGLTVATKAGAVNAAEVVAKNALKEGVTGAVSAAKTTAGIFDKGRIVGSGLTEKLGKAFRVSGEVVDAPITKSLNWIKRQADELLDTNLHQTQNGNLRVTGPTKGQAGFGGSIMAGFGLGAIGLPYASAVVPVWAVANAAKIGGAFFEGLGREMASGKGALKRLGGQVGSSGKLARTFDSWSPMGGYVKEMSKAVAKSGLYGAGIGYAVGGEEGAAQGLGMGAAIGTTHYHYGVAHNMIKGQSREKMTADLIGNVTSLRERGFTKKADTVLKYLEEIREQHGDDAYFRNLGVYLGMEADAHVALDVWDKEDYIRIANDPSVPQYVRDAVNEVIGSEGQGWNGLFLQRNGESKPYFIRKDSQSGQTHVIINAWAVDNAGKRQATGLKGEFFHVLSDAYKQASTKEKFKEEVFEGLVRTLNLNHTEEGRANMAQILRNAANNLGAFKGAGMKQKASVRAKNLLRLQRKNSPNGWKVDFVGGNEVITEGKVQRPAYYWESNNGWRIQESSSGYDLTGRIEGKPFRKSYRTLSEAVAEHREIAPVDTQVKSAPRKPKATQFEAQAGPRAGEREGFQETVADVELGAKVDSIIDSLVKKLSGKSGAEFRDADKSTYDTFAKGYKQALSDGWIFDEARVDSNNDGWYHPDYPNATLQDWLNADGTRKGQEPATPPNVSGERTAVTPEAKPEEPKQQKPKAPELEPEEVENIFRQIDEFEKTGKLPDGAFSRLIEEMGEGVFDAFEEDMPFDYLYLAGDLGFARNLIEELKHRIARTIDRNGRQAGFVPDFEKPFVEWFKDKDGKAIYDPYMRDLFKKFLAVHQNRKSNLDFYNVDWQSFSPASLKAFVEENNIEHEFDIDPKTGNYARKSDEVINREQHYRYQAAFNELINLKKSGVDIGFEVYAHEKDSGDIGSLDEENNNGTLKQQAWKQYRTTTADIREAQRRGTIPTKEELEQAVQTANFGKRGRARTGEIDDIEATARKGSIIFSGVPTLEAFKVLQKHMMKNEINAIMQIAPVILEGGINAPNVLRVKYAGFTHAPEEGKLLKKPKNEWKATEKNMVFYHMELRGTLRNLKSGKFDYKKPHAHFLLHGVDIDALQRRIQWMWKNEKETSKRWSNMVEFEKDVYRLIENYSARSAIGGSRFFGGGSEGKAKKRLACAAIGAFPTRKMVGGVDGDEIEMDMPEIDWHHYQFRAYGKGNAGRDIPWTILRGEGIKKVYGSEDTMRVPYAERAYYRAQELYQQASKNVPREGDETPANMRFVSQELQAGRVKQIFSPKRPTGDWQMVAKGYTPNDIIKSIVDGQFKLSPEKDNNALAFVKGGIGHDEATNSALVFWHWAGSGVPFEKIEQGQIGLHIGTREAALYRAMKVSEETGKDPASVGDNVFPLVVNIKKPITLLDRGSWTPLDIVETILYAHGSEETRAILGEPRVEGRYDRQMLENVKRATGPLSLQDIIYLKEYQRTLIENGINASNTFLAQAEMAMGKGQTPKFVEMSKRMYKAAEPLHKWLQSKGVDGIKYRNRVEGKSWSYIAFSGKQVKHLVQNSGEYSQKNLSMMRQQAARFGAKSADDAVSLEANYRKAVQEGDIFKSIAIKENFLGGLPTHARVIRQSADEAMKQGVTLEQYNSQFTTGTPAVFPVIKELNQKAWSSHMLSEMETGQASIKTRALIKTRNPLVVDASGLAFDSPELSANAWINKATNAGHDSVVFTNTIESGFTGASENTPLHNKVVQIGADSVNNIAVIDENTSRQPVPRGAGILNDAPLELPFRQEAAKRTFYSAVEKFVQEKITDKTSLNELLGLLDPTKGTGITKSELEFLDIAGWVEEQKKITGGTKAKVNKQALLEYIEQHKFELQEDKTNTAWYSLQGLDPNNPAVQSQVEGGYEGYAPANKGYDTLHPSTNYRVLLLRAPAGTDYSGGEGGHFPKHENIMAFARVSDVWLDRVTEMPSPPVTTPKSEDKYIEGFVGVTDEQFGHRFGWTLDKVLKDLEMDFQTFKDTSSDDIFRASMSGTKVVDSFSNGAILPTAVRFEKIGFVIDRLMEAKPELHGEILAKFKEVFNRNAKPNPESPRGIENLNKDFESTSLANQTIFPHSIMRGFSEGVVDKSAGLNSSPSETVGKYNFFLTDTDGAYKAFTEALDIIKSYMIKDETSSLDPNAGKKKMLFVMEIQSDTAQKMQGRNDARTENILTQQEFDEKVRIEDAIRDVQFEINDAVESVQKTGSRMVDVEKEFPELYARRQELKDKLSPLLGKEKKTVISQRDFEKVPEVKEELKKRMEVFDTWENWGKSKEKNLERTDLIDDGFNEGTSAVMDKIGLSKSAGIITDEVAGGRDRFIENMVVLIDRILAGDVTQPNEGYRAKDTLRGVKESILEKNDITIQELNQVLYYSRQNFAIRYDQSRLPYYDLAYFLGIAEDASNTHRNHPPTEGQVKRVGRIMHEEVAKLVKDEIFDTSVSNGRGFAFGAFKTNDFSKKNLYSIIDAKADEFAGGTLERVVRQTPAEDTVGRAWSAWEKHSLSDRGSRAYHQFREKVLHMVIEGMNIHERQSPNSSQTREQVKTAQLGHIASSRDTVVTEFMPFMRTEDFTKLMFKKLLREAVSNGYEGIIFIPPEMPQILTNGDSRYFYGKIVPKVVEGYTKKFDGKLRQNKSVALMPKPDPLINSINDYLVQAARDNHGGNYPSTRQEAWESITQYAKNYIALEGSPVQSQMKARFVDEIAKTGKSSTEIAEQIFDHFVGRQRGTLPESQKGWQLGDKNDLVNTKDNIDRQASRKGLILDITPKMDAIKEGQPMWQAAARRPKKPNVEGQPETVGDVRGLGDGTPIAKKQDRSIGERPEGSEIPDIPKQTSGLEVGGVGGMPTSIDKKLATEGVADYRGYKIIYDKANGGYRITNPSGKMVPIPIQYKDKFTGETVIKNERTVVFPSEATFLIDYLLGGMPKTPDAPSTPALAKPAQVKQQVVEPAQRAIPKNEPASAPANELGIVKSQLETGGKSKYYFYNIEFDPKTNDYTARDNSGQIVQTIVDSTFQSGPRTMLANRNPSLESLLGQLDKKFDKTKYARLAPRAQTATAQPAPVAPTPVAPASVAPVAPVEPVATPSAKPVPTRRVAASSVPPAVAQATPAPAPKPKATPKPKQNVNKPKPKVVMPAEPVVPKDAEISPSQSTQPVEVVSDKEFMEKQAKALGKGFIEMMKDPELSQHIIDSLNVDDNLTLKGDGNSASTADGRFSVDKKGKKYVVMQNNYQSPITGLNYDRRTIAYVNTLQQAQILIRRLEVERNMQLKMRGMPLENPLMVMAAENPAFEQLARDKAIRDNAMIMMLLSMRDQGITPIYIDPNTLQPILVMMPSEEAISQVTRPTRRQPQIAGLLPESGGQEKLLPAVLDDAIKFDYIQDAQIRQMSKYTKDVAERYRNKLGYEILKFQGKFRLFNPLKASVSVRDDEDAIMNDLIRDIAKKGLQR
jgi:hypothetical protein